ncbi:MAG: hypothetical protein IKU30_03320 [Clostridia bacterium]|nr:hypothetical protein [Clostridia bacterium]
MRRAIIFLVLLALMCGIAFAIYSAYSNHDEISDLIDLSSKARKIDENGTFTGKFKPTSEILKIKRFSYKVIEDDLYISIYVGSAGDFMETDDEGYVTVEIKDLPDIDKIYYDNGEDKSVLTADRD